MTDLSIANEIYRQLGGRRFAVMTGAKNFVGGADSLTFKIGRNSRGITHIKIILSPLDLYDVQFLQCRMRPNPSVKTIDGYSMVMAGDLQGLISRATGLDTHL